MLAFISHLGTIRTLGLMFILVNFCSCASGSISKKDSVKTTNDTSNEQRLRMEVVRYARNFLDKPYKQGGRNEKGFDCSGFVCYVLKHFDITMEASSQDQAKEGKNLNINELKPGDLIYFGDKKRIHHVGIITERRKNSLMIIHSTSSKGVIEEDILKSDYWLKRIRFFKELKSFKSNNIVFKS
ncbi:MAG: C40 family peptidase [Saprospiraceae bacterium]